MPNDRLVAVTEHLVGRIADLREMFILCAVLSEMSA